MSDLINRQDAIYALTEANLKSHMDSVEGGQENRSAIRIIMELPSAERKHGEWIVVPDNIGDFQKAGYRWIKCNKCTNQVKIRLDSPLYDFCPYCGADMRERREDE